MCVKVYKWKIQIHFLLFFDSWIWELLYQSRKESLYNSCIWQTQTKSLKWWDWSKMTPCHWHILSLNIFLWSKILVYFLMSSKWSEDLNFRSSSKLHMFNNKKNKLEKWLIKIIWTLSFNNFVSSCCYIFLISWMRSYLTVFLPVSFLLFIYTFWW